MSDRGKIEGLIEPPGPRLKKNIDLKFVRAAAHGKKTMYAELNLTSMVDMLTILTVFLLMTFSAPVSFGTLPNGCTVASGEVTCNFPSTPIPPISIPVIAPFARSLTATAYVSSAAADPDSTNNNASDVVQIRLRPLSRKGLPVGIP